MIPGAHGELRLEARAGSRCQRSWWLSRLYLRHIPVQLHQRLRSGRGASLRGSVIFMEAGGAASLLVPLTRLPR